MENDDGLVQVPDENPLRSPGQSGDGGNKGKQGEKEAKSMVHSAGTARRSRLVNRPGACFCAPQGPGIHLLGPFAATLPPLPVPPPTLSALCITVINSDKLIN